MSAGTKVAPYIKLSEEFVRCKRRSKAQAKPLKAQRDYAALLIQVKQPYRDQRSLTGHNIVKHGIVSTDGPICQYSCAKRKTVPL